MRATDEPGVEPDAAAPDVAAVRYIEARAEAVLLRRAGWDAVPLLLREPLVIFPRVIAPSLYDAVLAYYERSLGLRYPAESVIVTSSSSAGTITTHSSSAAVTSSGWGRWRNAARDRANSSTTQALQPTMTTRAASRIVCAHGGAPS